MEAKELTLGEVRVRTQFNASNSGTVAELKAAFARLIDQVNDLEPLSTEHPRLKNIAITTLEEAAMWAVKAATK